jgi:uncharacterized protein DUF6677
MAEAQTVPQTQEITGFSIVALIAGWLVPGAGHFLQKRWIRGSLLMISTLAMFTLGIAMNGKVYDAHPADLLDMLGIIGDIGSGLLYIIAVVGNLGHAAIQMASADYGTKFIIVAGLMNIVAAVDAHQIALGKKN